MRAPDNAMRPRRRRRLSTRGRVIAAVIAAAVLVLFMSLRGIAGFYTDYLWFDSLGYSSIWRGMLGARVALGVIFTGVFFALMWTNLLIADRLAPRFRPSGPEEELLERYYEVVGRRTGLVRFCISGIFALIAGAGVSQQWNSWLLFTNRVNFGTKDPLFNLDIGFFVFQLPFLSFVVSWLFAAFIIILIVTVVAHYLNGGIRVQTPAQRVTAAVKGHISVLLGVLALIKAAEYLLQRYELTVSERGIVDGAGYTDIQAKLPALNLLLLISVLSFGLFLFNIKRRGWTLPVVGVGLWMFATIIAGSAYPWFVQRFLVEARGESTKEQPYIARNIAATRDAYGLSGVQDTPFAADTNLSLDDVKDASADGAFRNVRLLDPEIISAVYNRRQAKLGRFSFPSIPDVDRYPIDGVPTATLIAARELKPDGVPQKSWEGQRLTYTQGYGVVLSPAGEVRNEEPGYVISELGPTLDIDTTRTDLTVTQPRLYFTEASGSYVVVNTGRSEIAFDGDTFSYDGKGGVGIGSFNRRLAFALRFGELNPLISNFIKSDSKILFIRNVRERVQTVAPFLSFDENPYPVLAEGRVYYVLDGYTTTSRYPYSQRAEVDDLTRGAGLRQNFNYVRNSVKAVIDAYNGTVTLYLAPGPDGAIDPIAQAYAKAFPKLFQPLEQMPAALQAHLRHPEEMFRIQTSVYGNYHVTDPAKFYNREDRWAVAGKPVDNVRESSETTRPPATSGPLAGVTVSGSSLGERMEPQYQLMTLPGRSNPDFVVLREFVPISDREGLREDMTSFMAAEPNGNLVSYRITSPNVPGPTLLTSKILADQTISAYITPRNSSGSTVQLGNRLLLPIRDSVVWVVPLYVTATGTSNVPLLSQVIVAYGNRIEMAPRLGAALTKMFGGAEEFDTLEQVGGPLESGTGGSGPAGQGGSSGGAGDGSTTTVPPGGSTTSSTLTTGSTTPSVTSTTTAQSDQQLTQQALQLFKDAEAALAKGDLGTYQANVNKAKALIEQLAANQQPKTDQPGKT